MAHFSEITWLTFRGSLLFRTSPGGSLFQDQMAHFSIVKTNCLPTIAEIAIADGRFDTLVAALFAAGLAETFLQPGDYTVFAPTDDAFAALPAGTVEALLADPTGQLTNILTYHVVGDSLSRDQIATDDNIPTLVEGQSLTVNRDGNNIIDISGAKLLITDIRASKARFMS